MKSFGIKRDENDPRWSKFIEWLNGRLSKQINGYLLDYYGFCRDGSNGDDSPEHFDRIITLDEWESEFMKPRLAGREYDERLMRDWLNSRFVTVNPESLEKNGLTKGFNKFLNQRYPNPRIAEIKAQMEKLSNELKELEG